MYPHTSSHSHHVELIPFFPHWLNYPYGCLTYVFASLKNKIRWQSQIESTCEEYTHVYAIRGPPEAARYPGRIKRTRSAAVTHTTSRCVMFKLCIRVTHALDRMRKEKGTREEVPLGRQTGGVDHARVEPRTPGIRSIQEDYTLLFFRLLNCNFIGLTRGKLIGRGVAILKRFFSYDSQFPHGGDWGLRCS